MTVKPTDSSVHPDMTLPPIPSLNYWLVTPGVEVDQSPFQLFGQDILNKPFAGLIQVLSTLPASATEIFAPADKLPNIRNPWSAKKSSIVGLPTFISIWEQHIPQGGLHVILGLPKEIEAVQAITSNTNVIFVTTQTVAGAISLEAYTGHLGQLLDQAIMDAWGNQLDKPDQSKLIKLPIRNPFPASTTPSRVAGVTLPNECLSTSLGFSYNGSSPLDPRVEGVYITAITESAEHSLSLMSKERNDLILYAPSIMRHLYAFGSQFWNSIFRKIKSPVLRKTIRDGIFRNPGYSGIYVDVDKKEAEEVKRLYDDPVAAPLTATRQAELYLTASSIAALASNRTQPALRLPNAINLHNADLRDIERYSNRDDQRGRQLLQRTYKNLTQQLSHEIDTKIIDFVRDKADSITLVTDAPIEWLPIDGLPLMIRHETSRIGMTPGNMMLAQCVDSDTAWIPDEELLDVLVIRSFDSKDPISKMLEVGLSSYKLERTRVTIVDVHNSNELAECLNAFKGAIVVFDCHGGHGGDDENGWLLIGEEKVDTWQLAHVARIPPIVILSACSTFALSGSHASVGNGLIRSGAITVIGTFLPVNSIDSSVFVSRLLYRIDTFLPAIYALKHNVVNWRTLISTFLRMSYATDVLRYIHVEKQLITGPEYKRIGYLANTDINTFVDDWYKRLVNNIAISAQRETEVIHSILDESPLRETMYYCQIGRPEIINIYLGEPPSPS